MRVLIDAGATLVSWDGGDAGADDPTLRDVCEQVRPFAGVALAVRHRLGQAAPPPLVGLPNYRFVGVSALEYDDTLGKAVGPLGRRVLFDDVAVSYDDDPSWVLSKFEGVPPDRVGYFQLELLPEVENAWRQLRDECPKHPDELQIEDVDGLCRGNPVLISPPHDPRVLREVVDRFPHAAGFAFNVGSAGPPHLRHAGSLALVRDCVSFLAARLAGS